MPEIEDAPCGDNSCPTNVCLPTLVDTGSPQSGMLRILDSRIKTAGIFARADVDSDTSNIYMENSDIYFSNPIFSAITLAGNSRMQLDGSTLQPYWKTSCNITTSGDAECEMCDRFLTDINSELQGAEEEVCYPIEDSPLNYLTFNQWFGIWMPGYDYNYKLMDYSCDGINYAGNNTGAGLRLINGSKIIGARAPILAAGWCNNKYVASDWEFPQIKGFIDIHDGFDGSCNNVKIQQTLMETGGFNEIRVGQASAFPLYNVDEEPDSHDTNTDPGSFTHSLGVTAINMSPIPDSLSTSFLCENANERSKGIYLNNLKFTYESMQEGGSPDNWSTLDFVINGWKILASGNKLPMEANYILEKNDAPEYQHYTFSKVTVHENYEPVVLSNALFVARNAYFSKGTLRVKDPLSDTTMYNVNYYKDANPPEAFCANWFLRSGKDLCRILLLFNKYLENSNGTLSEVFYQLRPDVARNFVEFAYPLTIDTNPSCNSTEGKKRKVSWIQEGNPDVSPLLGIVDLHQYENAITVATNFSHNMSNYNVDNCTTLELKPNIIRKTMTTNIEIGDLGVLVPGREPMVQFGGFVGRFGALSNVRFAGGYLFVEDENQTSTPQMASLETFSTGIVAGRVKNLSIEDVTIGTSPENVDAPYAHAPMYPLIIKENEGLVADDVYQHFGVENAFIKGVKIDRYWHTYNIYSGYPGKLFCVQMTSKAEHTDDVFDVHFFCNEFSKNCRMSENNSQDYHTSDYGLLSLSASYDSDMFEYSYGGSTYQNYYHTVDSEIDYSGLDYGECATICQDGVKSKRSSVTGEWSSTNLPSQETDLCETATFCGSDIPLYECLTE